MICKHVEKTYVVSASLGAVFCFRDFREVYSSYWFKCRVLFSSVSPLRQRRRNLICGTLQQWEISNQTTSLVTSIHTVMMKIACLMEM